MPRHSAQSDDDDESKTGDQQPRNASEEMTTQAALRCRTSRRRVVLSESKQWHGGDTPSLGAVGEQLDWRDDVT